MNNVLTVCYSAFVFAVGATSVTLALPSAAGASTMTLVAADRAQLGFASSTCGAPQAAARLIEPWFPEIPALERLRNTGRPYGLATIAVDLDANGTARAARVFRSTGSAMLDREAQSSALRSRYSAERWGCVEHGGTYLVDIDFDG